MNSSAPSDRESTSDPSATDGLEARGILCVKCESLNPKGSERCKRCDSHLFVFCHRCGGKNARVHSRCEHCRRSLHRSAGDRLRGTDSSISLMYVGLAILVILLVIVVLIWASDFRKS